jgi:hypothetical protein
MKHKNLIALKAFFLLIVFCMSTMVSFACAMGVEMGYNKNHHQEIAKEVPSAHKHKLTSIANHKHSDNAIHEHADSSQHQHAKPDDTHSKNKADDCCKKEAKKFSKFDKIVVKTSQNVQQPVFFILFVQTFYSFDILKTAELISLRSNLYRSHHPPISDKRIAIQSFLI